MPNQQKYRPISFRPPEGDRLWLLAYKERTGKPMNAILTEAVRRLRVAVEAGPCVGGAGYSHIARHDPARVPDPF